MAVVLFVCTGNLCRSPSAEGFLAQRLSELGPPDVTVESAGTTGTTIAIPRNFCGAAAYGLDLGSHVPRKVDSDTIARADLIIGMARSHVREIVVSDPSSFTRAFTLREIVRRGTEKGKRGRLQPVNEWLGEIGAGRRHQDLLGESPVDDIPDPMGGTSQDYRAMLAEVAALTPSTALTDLALIQPPEIEWVADEGTRVSDPCGDRCSAAGTRPCSCRPCHLAAAVAGWDIAVPVVLLCLGGGVEIVIGPGYGLHQ